MAFQKSFKPACRYQFRELLPSAGIYYLAILCIYLFVPLFFSTVIFGASTPDGGSSIVAAHIGGSEMASMIFLLVVGLNSFKPQFLFFLANTRSRRLFFVSRVAALLSLDLLMAVIDSLIGLTAGSLSPTFFPAYFQLYAHRFSGGLSSLTAAQRLEYFGECLLWSFVLYALFTFIGFAVTILYYRMNRLVKYLVSWGVPVLLFIFLPVLDFQLFAGRLSKGIAQFFTVIAGFQGTPNPFLLILTGTAGSLLLAAVSWVMVRRAEVK